MKRHENQIVSGQLIMNQWCNDDITASEHAGFEIQPDKQYEVYWPDHVTTPRFNCDCTILGVVD